MTLIWVAVGEKNVTFVTIARFIFIVFSLTWPLEAPFLGAGTPFGGGAGSMDRTGRIVVPGGAPAAIAPRRPVVRSMNEYSTRFRRLANIAFTFG
jgi:hypothetical protein